MRLPFGFVDFFKSQLLALAFVPLITGQSALAAESTPRGLTLTNYKIFIVRMDTVVKAPTSGLPCTNVRVWHALPTNRPWSEAQSPYGTLDQRATPSALIETEKDKRATHFYWNVVAGLKPGIERHFISDFRVVSADRRFDWSQSHLVWTDVLRANAESPFHFTDPKGEIADLATQLKYNKQPCETIIAFSKWIKDNFTYDANCTIDANDILTIMAKRRGHCLHLMTVFAALCNAANIQCRSVKGLNLHFANGTNDVDHTRNDYTNGHVWAEVFLPDIGWIEVEPYGGDKCFTVPATYVQNNTSFQNCSVWIMEQGQAPRMPRWVLQGDTYVNDYGVDNTITFGESRR